MHWLDLQIGLEMCFDIYKFSFSFNKLFIFVAHIVRESILPNFTAKKEYIYCVDLN